MRWTVLANAVLLVLVVLVPACGSSQESAATPLDRAKRAFGTRHSVATASVSVPGAQIFIATPDPVPPDYDGYDALLLPDEGEPLRGGAAVRFAWNQGVREPAALAPVAAIFVGNSQDVAGEEDKQREYIHAREQIEAPAIANNQLVFYVVRGSMAPTAAKVVVDLATYEAVPAR